MLTRLKAQVHLFPTIDVSYSASKPLATPVILNLPPNGLRLRFDGPDQRLRLIEMLDFTKTRLNYKNTDLVKLPEVKDSSDAGSLATGPAFRHIYNRLGPSFPGEYISPNSDFGSDKGSYILSYPGIAFIFPLDDTAWSPNIDFVSLLSSSAAEPANSMAIFDGQSWQEARQDLMVRQCMNPRSLALSNRGKDLRPREIDLVRIRGNGLVDLERGINPTFHIILGKTTPQDLVAELGPPDAIYRKSDRKMSIHKAQRRDDSRKRYQVSDHEDLTDTDQSSLQTATDDSDDEERSSAMETLSTNASAECFYNYFHHGIDVLISPPMHPAPDLFPEGAEAGGSRRVEHINQLVATKLLLHANVPGSYPFNRYRRCRWVIDASATGLDLVLDSETPFTTLSSSLQRIWRDGPGVAPSDDSTQKPFVINHELADSPGSSCEFLGGWEDSIDVQPIGSNGKNANDRPEFGNTALFGFPGLLFEILKNDTVSCLTVY